MSMRHELIAKLQEVGVIRQDVDAKIVAHIMNMLAYGLVGMDEVMAAADIPPTEDIVEGIADFMDRALTPEGGGDSEAGKAIFRNIFEASRRQMEPSRQPVAEGSNHDHRA